MNAQEFIFGESKNIEFKIEVPKNSQKYMKTIIAFANTAGGKLIIGIDDKTHAVIGVGENSVFEIMDQIANSVSDMCTPQIVPNIFFKTIDGKSIVIVEIYPGQSRPYYIKKLGKENGVFIRVAGTSRLADANKIKELELQGRNMSYDEIVYLGEPLDEESIEKLCIDMKNYMLESAKSSEDKQQIKDVTIKNLENWKILKRIDNMLMPTNALMLLTKNPFQYAKIQCGLFKGKDRAVFVDKREFTGPIYEQIEEAYNFVLKHINLGAEINGLVRKDVYELPVGAIREAIVNAVTHRNYMENSCVQVAIYEDRVEITSPGMLYGGLTLEMILSGDSKIRNTGIAEIFNRMKIIESWGTGIQRIINGCREYRLPDPEFLEMGDSFRVNIFRNLGNDFGANLGASPKNSFKLAPKTEVQQMTNLEKKIINLIDKDGRLSKSEMAEKMEVSLATIKNNITSLRNRGIIKYNGSSRNGYWSHIQDEK